MGNCLMNKQPETDLEDPGDKSISLNKSFSETRNQLPIQITDRSRSRRVSEKSFLSQSNLYFNPNADIQNPIKTEKDLSFIQGILSSHFLYTHLSKDQQELIIAQIRHLEVPAGQNIISQEMFTEYFWIIEKGSVEVTSNDKSRGLLTTGECIGQISLISNSVQTSSYKTTVQSSFWILDRAGLRNILQQMNSAEYAENKSFLESVPLFSILNKTQRELLLGSVTIVSYAEGQAVRVLGC